MAISILHRATGVGMAVVGAIALVAWLVSAANGQASYERFVACATSLPGYVILVGLTWAFFQHLFSGLRHFVLDMGAGYELKTNKSWSVIAPVAAILVTAAIWLVIFSGSF